MVEASFSLISTKNRLMRCSVDRYERIHVVLFHDTYLDIMSEISKRMDTKDENSYVRSSTLSTVCITSSCDTSRSRIHNQRVTNILLLMEINSQPPVLCNFLPTIIFRLQMIIFSALQFIHRLKLLCASTNPTR